MSVTVCFITFRIGGFAMGPSCRSLKVSKGFNPLELILNRHRPEEVGQQTRTASRVSKRFEEPSTGWKEEPAVAPKFNLTLAYAQVCSSDWFVTS
jgi:hypothetical protein